MGVKVGASEVGVYLGAEKLAGVGGSDVSNIKTSFNDAQGSGTIEFTVNAVTTQRNFLLTTRSLSGGDGATIQVLHNSAWETVGSISSAEISVSSGFTFKGTFPKDNNESANVSFKLLPVGEANFDGYAMVVYD